MRFLIAALLSVALLAAGCGGPGAAPNGDPPPGAPGGGSQPADAPADGGGPAAEFTSPAPAAEVGRSFAIKGRARVWEATMQLEIEDGHDVLWHEVLHLSRGAPDWAPFDLTVNLPQLPTNRTITLIAYIASPKDGSRQELAVRSLKYTGPCAENRC